MTMNTQGMGFVFTAQNLGKATFKGVQKDLQQTAATSEAASARIDKAMMGVKAGAVLAGVGAAGLALMGAASAESLSFGKAIAEVSTLIDGATFSTDKMRQMTMDAAAAFGGDAQVQAQALYNIISAGASNAASAQAMLTSANKLAVGGVTDVNSAVDILTSSVNVYTRSGMTAAQASDSLFTAVKAGKTTVEELAMSLGRVLPTAESLRISFDEVNAAVAAMTANGLQTSRAVTGLNSALAGIKKPTKDAQEEAARLGIQFNEAALRSQGLQGFLSKMIGSANFTEESFSKLFGSVEGVNAIISLTAGGMKKFNSTMVEMGGKTGATDRAFEKMSKTLDFQIGRFNALKKNVLIMIGTAVEPMLAMIVDFGNFVGEAFAKIPGPVRTAVIQMIAIASAVAFAAGTVLVLKSGLMLLGVTWKAFSSLIGKSLLALGPWLLAIGAVVVAIKLFSMAWEANLGGIRDFGEKIFGKIRLLWNGLTQLFTQGGFSGAVRKELNEAGNKGLKNFVVGVFLWVSQIKAFFRGMGEGLEGLGEVFAPVFTLITEILTKLGKALGFAFGGPNDPTVAATKFDMLRAIGVAVGTVLRFLAEILIGPVIAGLHIVSGAIDFAVAQFEMFKTAIGFVKDAAIGWVDIIQAKFGELSLFLRTAFVSGITSAAAFFAKHAGKIITIANRAIGATRGFLAAVGIGKPTKEIEATRGLLGPVGIGEPTEAAAEGGGDSPAARAARVLGPGAVAAETRIVTARFQAAQEAGFSDEQMAKLARAIAAERQPVIIELDGEQVGEITSRATRRATARSFSEVPTGG